MHVLGLVGGLLHSLHAGVERREHLEARALEVARRVVGRELPAHECEERGLRRAAPRARQEVELAVLRALCLRARHEAVVGHLAEHEVAALERALGMAAWVVVGRPADDGDEQRELVEVELVQRFAEIELAREPEAVHRAVAVLAEIDLVYVRLHEIVLVVAQLERQRHERLVQLAGPGPLVAEKIAANELLSQRARALLDLAGREVHERGPQHRERVDAVMLREASVLDRDQRGRQERRGLVGRDDQAILAVRGEETPDQERIEPCDRGVLAAFVADVVDAALRERERDEPRGLDVARVVEAPGRDLDSIEPDAVSAGPRQPRILAIAQALELAHEVLGSERAARIELERRRVDLRGQVPAPALELPAD